MCRHADNEIQQAARNFRQLANVLDPTTAKVESVDHAATTRSTRYRLDMAAIDTITVSLDASIVAQAREQLGEPVAAAYGRHDTARRRPQRGGGRARGLR